LNVWFFLKPFLYFNILSIIWQLLLSVKWQNHEILKPAISGFYIRFHPVYWPCFDFTRKQMTPFYWQQKLPDNREYIKIQEWLCINNLHKLFSYLVFSTFSPLDLASSHQGYIASCYRFSCYYRFSDIAINSEYIKIQEWL
jgi:hypothetical protein